MQRKGIKTPMVFTMEKLLGIQHEKITVELSFLLLYNSVIGRTEGFDHDNKRVFS
jgi:hypothetical protein